MIFQLRFSLHFDILLFSKGLSYILSPLMLLEMFVIRVASRAGRILVWHSFSVKSVSLRTSSQDALLIAVLPPLQSCESLELTLDGYKENRFDQSLQSLLASPTSGTLLYVVSIRYPSTVLFWT